MIKLIEKPIIVMLLLLVLSSYLFFFQLDKIALTDPDETFYAQTAKEMLHKGEWLTPTLYGKPQFEKPILFYWLVEVSYKIFGINEFAARFPSALFGFMGLVAIYLLGRLLFNNRVGIYSAVVLATNLEYIMLSIGCVTDMVLSTLMLLGVLFFFYGQIKGKGYFYLLSSAAFAFATLTKGPIGLILPGFIIALHLIITKDFAVFKRPAVLIGAAIVFGLIAKPWYIVMFKLHGKAFIDEFFGFHNLTRFLTPEHRMGSEIYYNIPIVLGGFFPWSVFLPLGFWRMFKTIRNTQYTIRTTKQASIFVLLWFFIIFIFFSVSSTKLPTYIFPCFISLALIVGKLWDDFLKRGSADVAIKKFMGISFYLLIVVILFIVAGMHIFLKMYYPAIARYAIVSYLFMAFGTALSFIAFSSKKFTASFFLIAYSVAIVLYPVSTMVLPRVEQYETTKPLSKELLKFYKDGEVIGCEKDYRAGVAFYTDHTPVNIDYFSTLANLIDSKSRVWCVAKKRNIADLTGPGADRPRKITTVYSDGHKKLLITNKALK